MPICLHTSCACCHGTVADLIGCSSDYMWPAELKTFTIFLYGKFANSISSIFSTLVIFCFLAYIVSVEKSAVGFIVPL